jgi:endonuclease/exonuclease/phosphatase family metal-dependent hydrolase
VVGLPLTLRLATFNIQHGKTPAGRVDIKLLATACAALEADVLSLQEVDDGLRRSRDTDTAATVAEACGMAHVFGPAIEVRGGRYGNALLVRGEIDDVDVIPLEDTEPRSGIVATAVVHGHRLSVCATHLGLRGQATAQLPVLLDALRARPAPRVLLGDLNLHPEDVVAPGFTRVEAGPTFPAKAPRREIDHVLLDGLVATAAVVVPLPVSDHRALVVEVRSP